MTVQSDMALLAAGPYWDIRQGEFNTETGKDTDNRAPLPAGWTLLPQFDISRSGINSSLIGDGFSARVYQGPGGQIGELAGIAGIAETGKLGSDSNYR